MVKFASTLTPLISDFAAWEEQKKIKKRVLERELVIEEERGKGIIEKW